MVDQFVRRGGQAHAPGGGGGKDWELPFREVVEVLRYHFQRDGKGTQGVEMTLRKGMGSWLRDVNLYGSKSVSLTTKCQRVISQVFSAALNSSANWTWNVYKARMVHRWEIKDSALNFHSDQKCNRVMSG